MRTLLATFISIGLALASAGLSAEVGGGARLKDIAALWGPVAMPAVGYGLVVGLNKTGDRRQTIFSAQTLASMLERFGVAVSPNAMKVENIAAVVVTAEIGPYTQNGGASTWWRRRSATRAACGVEPAADTAARTRRRRGGARDRCRLAGSARAAGQLGGGIISPSAACRAARWSSPSGHSAGLER
jgi:hypothetical protein